MASAPSDNLPPEKILEPEPSMTRAEEEKLFYTPNDQKLARENQLKDARLAADWLGSALGVTRVVRDSSADVVSVLSSFVDDLSSAISIHGSDCIVGDLEQPLPSSGPAKQSWESVAEIINTLMYQTEHLNSATDPHIKCLDVELEAQNMIVQQGHMALVTLTKSIDGLSHSMNRRLSILHPIYRMPAEILELIFEQATLEERAAVRAFRCNEDYLSLDDVYSTIPRIPTILASPCRHWRTIAFHMTRLWNFLRIPTFDTYYHPPGRFATRSCLAGIPPFRQALSHLGASECEVVVVPTTNWTVAIKYLHFIPRSQISVLTIMMLDSRALSQIPPARILRVYGKFTPSRWAPSLFPLYTVPASVLANTRALICHDHILVADAPIHSVTNLSLFLDSDFIVPDFSGLHSRFPNLIALAIDITDFESLDDPDLFIILHDARIRMLSITEPVVPHLCVSLKRGALSLPSLTHFILLDIFPPMHAAKLDPLQSLFVTVTHFDIRAGGRWKCGSYIRQILDLMPSLQQFRVFGTTVKGGVDALLIAPIKQVTKLVIMNSKTDGSDVNAYYDALSFESASCLGMSIQFVNCQYILPHIRERFRCR